MLKIRSKVCCHFGRVRVRAVSAHYIALLIYTCFCAYTMQARSTANGKIRREIQNPQMLETFAKDALRANQGLQIGGLWLRY
jgi:hypothetical protein